MSEAVVDCLEVVEIDEQDCSTLRSRGDYQPIQLVVEEVAVRQAGDSVVVGLTRQLLFEFEQLAK